MLRTNPKYVLRNHLGEQAIRKAKQGDFSEVETLLALLQAPFDEHAGPRRSRRLSARLGILHRNQLLLIMRNFHAIQNREIRRRVEGPARSRKVPSPWLLT
jgi:hypothetical protein